MKNIDRLARHITKHGAKDIIIHTIPKTKNWIICQKIEKDKWMLTLCDPMGNTTYNLGTVSDDQHLNLWMQITRTEIEKQTSQILLAKELKEKIYKFIKNYENNYKKFIKVENKQKCKICKQGSKEEPECDDCTFKEKNKTTKTKTKNSKKHKRINQRMSK